MYGFKCISNDRSDLQWFSLCITYFTYLLNHLPSRIVNGIEYKLSDLRFVFREDGKDSVKFYTYPGFFFELWVQGIEKEMNKRKTGTRVSQMFFDSCCDI